MNYKCKPQPMVCGQYEAQKQKYKKLIGKSGSIWLVGTNDPAHHVYVSDDGKDKYFKGFGGATLKFQLDDGSEILLKGPWMSNTDALYEDTGHDVRDKHITFVVISRDRVHKDGVCTMVDVIYKDKSPTPGYYNRGKSLAQEIANEKGHKVYCYILSGGGTYNGIIKPHDEVGNG
jgi:hypothetical protein